MSSIYHVIRFWPFLESSLLNMTHNVGQLLVMIIYYKIKDMTLHFKCHKRLTCSSDTSLVLINWKWQKYLILIFALKLSGMECDFSLVDEFILSKQKGDRRHLEYVKNRIFCQLSSTTPFAGSRSLILHKKAFDMSFRLLAYVPCYLCINLRVCSAQPLLSNSV